MKQTNCLKQEEVMKAIRSQQWPEVIAAHVTECEICRDVTQAARWMQALAGSSDAGYRGALECARCLIRDSSGGRLSLTKGIPVSEQRRLLLETLQIGSTWS